MNDTYLPGILAMAQVVFYKENMVKHDPFVNKNKEEKAYCDQYKDLGYYWWRLKSQNHARNETFF